MINFCSLEAGNEVASILQLLLVSSAALVLGLALFYLFFLNWSLCFCLFVCVLFLLLSSLLRPVCYFNFSLLVSFAGWLDYSSSFACFLARLPACLLAWLLACLPACLHSMFVLRCMFF